MVWIKGNSDTWFDGGFNILEPKTKIEKCLYNNYEFVLKCLTDEDLKILKRLLVIQKLEVNDYKVLCVHGSPRKINEDLSHNESEEQLKTILEGVKEDIILSGHTHKLQL